MEALNLLHNVKVLEHHVTGGVYRLYRFLFGHRFDLSGSVRGAIGFQHHHADYGYNEQNKRECQHDYEFQEVASCLGRIVGSSV
jgi:hypothetical protein